MSDSTSPTPKTNSLAIAGFISSFFFGLLGAILGHVALNQIQHSGEGGKGLATAAVVIGWTGVVFGFFIFFVI
jgi:hypothetical protein